MKTSCPFLCFAAPNLFWVLGWLSIIWEKDKVNGDAVVEASYTRRHVSYKKLVDLVFESLKLHFGKQPLFDVISDGVGTGAILQLSGGILHRAGLGRGACQYSPDVLLGVLVAFNDEVQMLHQGFNGELKDLGAGQFNRLLLLAPGHLPPPALGFRCKDTPKDSSGKVTPVAVY